MALDLSGQTAPTPRANPKPKAPGNSARAQAAKTAERAAGVEGLFQIAAFGSIMFGGRPGIADAGACSQHGPVISQEAATLAETSEPLAKAIDFVTAVGPFAALFAAAMPFALQILLNHGRIPNVPQLAQFGVVAPEVMMQRAELEAQRQQMELAQMMRDQQEEIQRMQRDAAA